MARSRESRSKIVAASRDRIMFVVEKQKIVSQPPSELGLGMKPHSSSTEQESDEFSKFMVKRKLVEERWESKRAAG